MSAEAYWTLIERTGSGCYYLWGPIQNALLMELVAGKTSLISEICTRGSLTKNRRMPAMRKDMLIQVLTIAGQEIRDDVDVKKLLENIIDERPLLQSSATHHKLVEAKKMIAEVAHQLRFKDILMRLLQDKDEDVRRTAVRSTFYLWREGKLSGEQKQVPLGIIILKELGDPAKISRLIITSRRRLQSCFDLSLSMLFEDYANPETRIALLKIWNDILGKLLWHRSSHGGNGQSLAGRIARMTRAFILGNAVRLALVLVRDLEKDRVGVYDIEEIQAFFKSSDDAMKMRFKILAQYIDPNAGNLKETKTISALKKIVTSKDIFSGYLLLFILGAHIDARPKETAEVIRELFREAIEFEGCEPGEPGLPSIPVLIQALSSASDRKKNDTKEIDAEILGLEEEIITEYQNRHSSICKGGVGKVRFIYSGLSAYPQYPKKKYGEVNKAVLRVFVENARSPGFSFDTYDHHKIRNYIMNVAVPGHPDYRDPEAILECLEPIMKIAFDEVPLKDLNDARARFQDFGQEKIDDFMKEKSINRKLRQIVVFQEYLIDALARIQVYAQEEVDDFMDKQGVPREIMERVRKKSSEEELAAAVTARATFFIRDMILRQPGSQLTQMSIEWFQEASNCGSLAEWVSSAAAIVLSALCGDELF